MYKLGNRNYSLISIGIKITGSFNPEECFPAFEEQLYTDESKIIYEFLKWVNEDSKNRAFGHGNYEQRFEQFLEEHPQFKTEEPKTILSAEQYKLLTDEIYKVLLAGFNSSGEELGMAEMGECEDAARQIVNDWSVKASIEFQ